MLFNPVAYFVPKLFWLEHRGIMHSFLGVIPFVFIALLILSIPKVKKVLSLDSEGAIKPLSIIGFGAFYFGVTTHLMADFLVPTGMMLFFPITLKWYGAKILSTNNIHSLTAFMTASTFWPLRWDKKRRTVTLGIFIAVFTFFSSVRIASTINATNIFQEKYGPGYYSSNELLFTYTINYKVYNDTNPLNRTFIITTIDGVQKKIISEELIPERLVKANSSSAESLADSFITLTQSNEHYYRLKQKYQFVCARAEQHSSSWEISWFSPIRLAQTRANLGILRLGSSPEIRFHIDTAGTIFKIERPISI
jgi:membrane-bound metal-dependent hydrolase YbcI (DUF457 family)